MSMRRSFLLLITRYRSRIGTSSPHQPADTPSRKYGYGWPMKHGLQFLNVERGLHSESDAMRGTDNKDNDQPQAPLPPKPTFPTWIRWVLGSFLSLLLPFGKQKWESFLRLEGEVEKVVEGVENVAEVVEKVANVAEKVSEDVADNLPKDGKLKDAALLVERVSKAVAKDAQLTQDIIHKVDELKEDVETLIEPFGTKEKDARGL